MSQTTLPHTVDEALAVVEFALKLVRDFERRVHHPSTGDESLADHEKVRLRHHADLAMHSLHYMAVESPTSPESYFLAFASSEVSDSLVEKAERLAAKARARFTQMLS